MICPVTRYSAHLFVVYLNLGLINRDPEISLQSISAGSVVLSRRNGSLI